MRWTDLATWWSGNKLEQSAHQLAARAAEALFESATNRVQTMSPAEARGYLRARAGVAVRATAHELNASQFSSEARSRIIELAIDQVVRLVIKKQTQTRTVAFVRNRAA